MEVEEETDCLTDMEPMLRDRRRRTKLLPEHQMMQKKSQKLQSLQDKKRNYLKQAGDCAGALPGTFSDSVPHDRRSFREKSAEYSAGNISQSQPLRSLWKEEKRKKSGTRRRRQVGGMKAPQWILLWILFGVKMPTVEALEEGIPAHQEMESSLLTALFPRGRDKTTWRVTDNCDERWRDGEHWQKKK